MLCITPAYSLETLALLGPGPSKSLLENKKPIYAETSGVVPVKYELAIKVLKRPQLMKDVQEAYCKEIDEDGTPEFVINQTSSNDYFYVNKNGERTDISEIMRQETGEGAFDIILFSKGKRFFGKYEAVIHVQVTTIDEKTSKYTASVYAYPKNMFSRFFARSLGLVEKFFHNKTDHMTEIITVITCELCEEDGEDV